MKCRWLLKTYYTTLWFPPFIEIHHDHQCQQNAENHFHTSCHSIVTCACAPWTIPLHPRRIRRSHQAQWTLGLVFQWEYYYSPMYPHQSLQVSDSTRKVSRKACSSRPMRQQMIQMVFGCVSEPLGDTSSFKDLDGVGVILKQDDHFRLQIGVSEAPSKAAMPSSTRKLRRICRLSKVLV